MLSYRFNCQQCHRKIIKTVRQLLTVSYTPVLFPDIIIIWFKIIYVNRLQYFIINHINCPVHHPFFNLILNYIYSTTIHVIIPFQLSTVSQIDNQDCLTLLTVSCASVLFPDIIIWFFIINVNQLQYFTINHINCPVHHPFFNLILNYIYSTTIHVIIPFQLSTVSRIDNQDCPTTVNSVLHISVIPWYHHLILYH